MVASGLGLRGLYMNLLYLDESGDPGWPPPYGRSQTNWFVLTGLSLEENKWEETNTKYIRIVKEYFGRRTENFDMKYSALKAGRHPYNQLEDIERNHLADEIFDLIVAVQPVLFAIVVDKLKHKQKYGDNARSPKILTLQFMAPRFHKYLERIDGLGMFVMDEEERKSDKKLKKLIQQARQTGIVLQTPFDPFRTNTHLPKLVESIFFVPSEDSPGIPLADFCCHAIWIHFERGLHDRFNQIQHFFDHVGSTRYGLKIWAP